MRNILSSLPLLVLAMGIPGCGNDGPHGFDSPAGEPGLVLGCPLFRPTTLSQTVIASGALVGSAESDIVTAELSAGSAILRIFAGTSDGSFSLSGTVTVTSQTVLPFAVLADATGDGLADIVICDPGGGSAGRVLVSAQQAGGTFAAPSTLIASAWPVAAAFSDPNNNGVTDVFVLENDGVTAQLRRIEANVVTTYSLPALYRFLTSGNFSASHDRCLAAAVSGGTTVNLLEVEAGSVTVWATAGVTGGGIAGLKAAEVTGDSLWDLLVRVGTGAAHYVKVLRNDSGPFPEIAQCGLGGIIHDFAASDTNGDGKRDVFVSEAKNGWDYVAVSYTKGGGEFDAPLRLIEGYWSSMWPGQFGGSTVEDMVFGDRYFFRGGDNPEAVRQFNLGAGPSAVAVGDFNGDGKADLAAFLNSSGDLKVALGTGTPWTFAAPITIAAGLWNPVKAAAGDLNGDGKLDLAIQDWTNLYTLYGDGAGGFAPPILRGPCNDFVLLDTDLDGVMEVAFTDQFYDRVRIFRGVSGTIVSTVVTGGPRGIATADFNGDGRPDLAVAANFSHQLKLLINNVGAVFVAGAVAALPAIPWAVAAGNFNGDAYPDVVVGRDGGQFWLLTGGAGGTLSAPTTYSSPHFDALAANDLNGDGFAELIALNSSDSLLTLYRGAAAPFQTVQYYPAAWNSWSLTVADVDGDLKPDVAVGNFAGSGTGDPILIWRNAAGDLNLP